MEKNLLKISLPHRNVFLQVVNTRTNHIFLWATSSEKEVCQLMEKTGHCAARAAASVLVRRARAIGQQQLTYERRGAPYNHKVKLVLDTLRKHGIEFVQHATERKKPKRPWDKWQT